VSFPYIPFYPADYLSKAHWLSLGEHGAYFKLMLLCWETPGCKIPAEREWIQRRLSVSDQEYETTVQPVLNEFFKRETEWFFNARLLDEFEKLKTLYESRKNNGKKGGRPAKKTKSLKNNKKSKTTRLVLGSENQNLNETETAYNQNQNQNHNKPSVSPLPPAGESVVTWNFEFEEWWKDQYPQRLNGRQGSKVKAREYYVRFRKEGVTKKQIWDATEEYFQELVQIDRLNTEYVKHASSWLFSQPWEK